MRLRDTKRTLAALAVVASGCAVGPDYVRPALDVPREWRALDASEAGAFANEPWWELFQDPTLEDLIRAALAQNKDLATAVARIEQQRALYAVQRAELIPSLGASGSAARSRASREGQAAVPAGVDPESARFQAGASLSWEIDLFGRIRRATEAEQATLVATEEARRAVVIELVSAVASAYADLRDFDARLAIARRTLDSRRDYVELVQARFEGGVTSELDWRQAQAELHRVETVVLDLERAVAVTEHALDVLLGRNPVPVPRGRALIDQAVPPAIPAGLPSELLERRPDVRQAEQVLASANARIGEAKALLFPQISLTGFFGWESTDLGNLFVGPAKAWSISGSLLQPIFNAGKNLARVEATEWQQRQALSTYELAVLQAFREVEDALVGFRTTGAQRVAQGSRVAAERKVLELAEIRYRGGVSAYLEVLDAQRSLFGAELDESQTVHDNVVAMIQLYKALGGGWTPDPTPSPAAP